MKSQDDDILQYLRQGDVIDDFENNKQKKSHLHNVFENLDIQNINHHANLHNVNDSSSYLKSPNKKKN